MITRRNLLSVLGLGSVAAGLATRSTKARSVESAAMVPNHPAGANRQSGGHPYTPVRSLNGWTLPYTIKGGVKEFHLIAEEVEHEFAPR